MQKILEKFEFFPIRCRVQRAADMFAKLFSISTHKSDDPEKIRNHDAGKIFKTKARVLAQVTVLSIAYFLQK